MIEAGEAWLEAGLMLLSSSEASKAQLDIYEAWLEAPEALKAIEAEHKAFIAKF